MGTGHSAMLPSVTEKEFCEHIEEDDFPIRYGNPVRIHTEDGRDLVCMTYELYERLTGDIVKMGYTKNHEVPGPDLTGPAASGK